MNKKDSKFKSLIDAGKEHGFLTYDEINKGIPVTTISADELDKFFGTLDDMGITVVEQQKDFVPKAAEMPVQEVQHHQESEEEITNPVRMYLSEMAKVALLDRGTEVMLAKSIRENERLLKQLVLESPLILKEIRNWETLISQQEMTPKELMPRGRKSSAQLRGMKHKIIKVVRQITALERKIKYAEKKLQIKKLKPQKKEK